MNVTTGDLAYIAASDYPENVGHVVEVLGRNLNAPSFLGPCWVIVSREPLKGQRLTGELVSITEISCPDADLRRINGTDDMLDVVVDERHDDSVAA